MNFFEKIVYALDAEFETAPTNYGLMHIIFLILTIGATIFLCLKFRDAEDKIFKRIILIFWLLIVLFEIYKEIDYTFHYNDGNPYWSYRWYIFPFQFCSTPFYAFPFVIFMKKGKIRDAFESFISFYVLFAGLAVMLYPNTIFTKTIGINIQSLTHHASQVIIGIYVMVHNRKNLSICYFLKGTIVFLGFLVVAMILNLTVVHLIPDGEEFNMFYISPYFSCVLPILSTIRANAPYVIFLISYSLGFIVVAFILYVIGNLIIRKILKQKILGKSFFTKIGEVE